MTTRTLKTSRTAAAAIVRLHCPACRSVQRCQPVGTGIVHKTRRELVECLDADCGLIWAPARTHVPAAAAPTN